MAAPKRGVGKPKKQLKVKKASLRDLPAKKKEADVKGGFAPPYVPVGPVVQG